MLKRSLRSDLMTWQACAVRSQTFNQRPRFESPSKSRYLWEASLSINRTMTAPKFVIDSANKCQFEVNGKNWVLFDSSLVTVGKDSVSQ